MSATDITIVIPQISFVYIPSSSDTYGCGISIHRLIHWPIILFVHPSTQTATILSIRTSGQPSITKDFNNATIWPFYITKIYYFHLPNCFCVSINHKYLGFVVSEVLGRKPTHNSIVSILSKVTYFYVTRELSICITTIKILR